MKTPIIWYGRGSNGWAIGITDPVVTTTLNMVETEQEAIDAAYSMAKLKSCSVYRQIKQGRYRFEESYS